MTWIKICGTTSLEDALMAHEAGADALGFVFYEDSPRNVIPEEVREIVKRLPEKIEKVGVFVNESFEHMERVAEQTGLTAIQVHADGAAKRVRGTPLHTKLKKYLATAGNPVVESFADQEPAKWADAVFLDSGTKQRPGGTGTTFDWHGSVPMTEALRRTGIKIVVAGGLTPANVADAIAILKPWGVDVVSGVESAPGKKDPEKVRAFIAAVRQADKSK